MSADELLGIHGVVIRTPRLGAWRSWSKRLGLPVLRRNRREIVFAQGPEIFVTLRKGRPDEPVRLLELHLAVERISARAKRSDDPMGGEVVVRPLAGFDLVLREFRRPPNASWRRKRIRRSS
jgi:hypothetical protein